MVEKFGLIAARAVLTQFGFAHGWRMAEAMQTQFNWASAEDWRRACTRISTLGGLFRVEPDGKEPVSKDGVMLDSSYRGRAAPPSLRSHGRVGVLDDLRPDERLHQSV
jgi:two-component system, NtrC family, response regulator HydG